MTTRPNAIWVKCAGEAHSNGSQADNCGVCLPYWEQYPTCSKCGVKLKSMPTGYRYRCKEHGMHVRGDRMKEITADD